MFFYVMYPFQSINVISYVAFKFPIEDLEHTPIYIFVNRLNGYWYKQRAVSSTRSRYSIGSICAKIYINFFLMCRRYYLKY